MKEAANPIVINCPDCRRVIWYNSICYHGQVPTPKEKTAQNQENGKPPPKKSK